jgi:hypothetical protein
MRLDYRRELPDADAMGALTHAIVAINGWNRLAVGLRQSVGSCIPRLQPSPA